MERNHQPDHCKSIDQDYRPIDCHRRFWLNRVGYWSRKGGLICQKRKQRAQREYRKASDTVVIEARWYEPFLDRFVFALRDGESLHDGIAGISVVGIGFGLCEATAAVIANSSSGGADSKNKPEKLAVDCEGDHRGGQSPRQGLRHRVGLQNLDVYKAQLYSMQSQPAF